MRNFLIIGCLLLLSACQEFVTYKEGSLEWVVKTYADALLEVDIATLKRYSVKGTPIDQVSTTYPQSARFHVVKLCPQGGDETRKYFLVIISGRADGNAHAFDMTIVNEGGSWRVERVQFSVDSLGAPRVYLRNCQLDRRYDRY